MKTMKTFTTHMQNLIFIFNFKTIILEATMVHEHENICT